MAPATANEVLILFSQALSSPADSEQQSSILEQVKEAIESDPAYIPILYSTILSVAPKAGYLLKRWIAEIVEFVVARLIILSSPISPEQRAHCEFPKQEVPSKGLVSLAFICIPACSVPRVFPVCIVSVSSRKRVVSRWSFFGKAARERKGKKRNKVQDSRRLYAKDYIMLLDLPSRHSRPHNIS